MRKEKLWVDTWKKAESALEEIKQNQLKSYDYAENQEIIDSMLQFAYEHRTTRLSSGLVEQQRWFMKMREKKIQTDSCLRRNDKEDVS